jgi:putative flippase GtrA
MIVFTEVIHIHYTISIVIGGIIGAVVNFLINRYWAFKSNSSYTSTAGGQLVKFASVAAGSILLKSSGTYLITENFKLDYRISRLIVDAFVAYGFNFVLMKYWVFKKLPEAEL